MQEQQVEEGRECAAAQASADDNCPEQETPRRPRGFSCYSVELLIRLEE